MGFASRFTMAGARAAARWNSSCGLQELINAKGAAGNTPGTAEGREMGAILRTDCLSSPDID
jgi:hypothetical protein